MHAEEVDGWTEGSRQARGGGGQEGGGRGGEDDGSRVGETSLFCNVWFTLQG